MSCVVLGRVFKDSEYEDSIWRQTGQMREQCAGVGRLRDLAYSMAAKFNDLILDS